MVPFEGDFIGSCANQKIGFQVIPRFGSEGIYARCKASWGVAAKDPCSLAVL